MSASYDLHTLLLALIAAVTSLVSLVRTRKTNEKIVELEKESVRINKDNEQRVYREKLIEMDALIIRIAMFQSKFDQKVEDMKKATAKLPNGRYAKLDMGAFVKSLEATDDVRKQSEGLQLRAREYSNACWSMEAIESKHYKHLQQECSELGSMLDLLDHTFNRFKEIFESLEDAIDKISKHPGAGRMQ